MEKEMPEPFSMPQKIVEAEFEEKPKEGKVPIKKPKTKKEKAPIEKSRKEKITGSIEKKPTKKTKEKKEPKPENINLDDIAKMLGGK